MAKEPFITSPANLAGYPVPYAGVGPTDLTHASGVITLTRTLQGVVSNPYPKPCTVTFVDNSEPLDIEVRNGAILHIIKPTEGSASSASEAASAAPAPRNLAFEAGEYNVILPTYAVINVLQGGTVELVVANFPNLVPYNGATIIDTEAALLDPSARASEVEAGDLSVTLVEAETGDLSVTLVEAETGDLGDAVARPEGGAALEAPVSEGILPVTGAEAVAAPTE